MSRQENLYIHLYTGVRTEGLTYLNPEECHETGQALLDFIYGDLSGISLREEGMAESMGRLCQIHPYFNHIPADARRLFMDNCMNPTYEGSYCIDGLKALQQKFTGYLNAYVMDGLTAQTVEHMGQYRLYSLSRYVMIDGKPMIDHFLMGFEDCLYMELMEIIRCQILIKVCKNCGRMFLPKKSNIDYCQRVFTEDGKTCQDVGYTQTFAKAVKSDELLQAYTRAYKAHYARMSKPRKRAGNLSREDFEKWYQEAKEKLNLAREGQLDAQEYKDWLKR